MSPEADIKVAVVGAAGRMGKEALRALTPSHGFRLVVANDRHGIGKSAFEIAGGEASSEVLITEKLGAALDQTSADVLLDFSHHSAAASHAQSALSRGCSVVIGCTGMSDSDISEIRSLTREFKLPAMVVPNFAVGAVLMMKFSQMAAKWMPDAEIIEMHHDRKEDAPSGTATLTAEMIGASRESPLTKAPKETIKVEGVRGGRVGNVPIHSIRLPGFLAHQQVLFGNAGETLTIRHDSTDRASFMQGVRLALREVRTLQGLTIGLDKILFRSS